MRERTRDILWVTFLALFAMFNAALIAGGLFGAAVEWRAGHRLNAIIFPAAMLVFFWWFVRQRGDKP